MTTKYRIIAGFFFMFLLMSGLSVFAYMSLDGASDGFTAYRAEAVTAVNANAADALMREAKSNINSFIISLNPALAEQARKNLENSTAYVQKINKVERSSANRQKLETQISQLKKISDLTNTLQTKLLLADKNVRETLEPQAAKINDILSPLNQAALAANDARMLGLVDDAYTTLVDFNVAVRLYNATYLPTDGEKANKLLLDFSGVLKKMDEAARGDMRNSYAVLQQIFDTYMSVFKNVDATIKEVLQTKAELFATTDSIAKFFDEYTTTSQQTMDRIGLAMQESNERAHSLLALGSVAGGAIGLIFVAWIILGVVRVLSRVSRFAEEIAHGNFKAQLSIKEGGEIGAMVKSILGIPTTLNAIAAEYSNLEQRVEDGYLNVQGDAGKFSGGFADLMQGTNRILKRMGLIFDNIPSPMVMLNKDLKASYLNKVAQDLAGTDYLGKTCEEMFCREDYGSSSCGLMSAVSTNEVRSGETVAHPRGKRLDVRYTAIPMKNAKGALSSVLQFIVDLTQIKDTERMIMDVAEQALENADRVAAASEELSAQIEQVSRGAEMQRTRIESTATAMNEMNATVLDVARNAGNASEQTEETRKKADNGADLVNKVVKAINGVNTVALALQDNMKELGKQAEGIGGVMNVISDIADQTNLLALNAAIEAARAGEAGRGFAVVADEVRKLAEKTMSATKEVGSNIQAIQNSARTNINEVSNAVTNIREATELSNASGQALNEIVNLSAANSTVVASIAAAAEEQSAASEEINRSLEDVSRIVAEAAGGMNQAASAVQDLSHTAQELKSIMERLHNSQK